MGEIDTDPIKSVRASLSQFGEKCSQIRSRTSSDDESEKEKGLEVVLRDLANCKVQLEAMDSAHKQALLNRDHHEKTVDDLSMLLKTSEFEKDIYINECKEARIHASQTESKIEEMADELSDLQSQLMAATDAKLEAIKIADKFNEMIISLQVSSMEAEKELKSVEEQLLSKSRFIDLLNSEVDRAHELQSVAESDLNKMKEDYELQEKMNSDKANYIELLESELTQLKVELKEFETIKNKSEEMKEAEVEIALLKAELHKGRSKTAAVEAAELRAKGEKSAAYFALQQMAIENQELKKKTQKLQSENDEMKFEYSNSEITISLEEYEMLVKKKAEEAKPEEMENLKRELESVMAKVSEFRTRAEQAATRAEVAEKAKAAMEEQIKGWKEQKQRRRAALAAMRAESMSRSSNSIEYDDNSKTYMPLGKFLKMSF